MIASPGDVASERAIARRVIHEWNEVHSQSRGIVLLPIGWESHSSPDMGKSAQDVINEQVLEKADMLVAVFWTRIGTPTNEHASGTVEEIEKLIAAGKPVMLYFSRQPVAMDTVDPIQVAAVKKFRESCQKRGLYEGYDKDSEFRDKFFHQLQITINDKSPFKDVTRPSTNEIIQRQIPLPSLSKEARILLKEAVQDPEGLLMFLSHKDGCDILTNHKDFAEDNTPEERSRWIDAIYELLREDLLHDTSGEEERFRVTLMGYHVAETIEI